MSFIREKKFLYLIELWILIILLYSIFLQSAIPPQMGWWNYYGWQVYDGKVLYKDLYCYMPPYYVWLSALLYGMMGNHLFYYEILGVIVTCMLATVLYMVFCEKISPCKSMLATWLGIIIYISYLLHISFDYNNVHILIVILAFATIFWSILYTKRLLLMAGIFLGIAMMIKQTSIIFFVVGLSSVLLFDFWNDTERKSLIADGSLLLCGVFLGILPGICYLLYTNSFFDMLQNLSIASEAKGIENKSLIQTIGDFFSRFYHDTFSYTEVIVSVSILSLIFRPIKNYLIGNVRLYTIIQYVLITGITFKIYRVFESNEKYFDTKAYFILNIIYLAAFLFKNTNTYERCKIFIEMRMKSIHFKAGWAFLLMVALWGLFSFCGYDERSLIYQDHNILFSLKRTFVEISFYTTLIYLCAKVAMLIKMKKEGKLSSNKKDLGFLMFIISVFVLQACVFISTSYMEEVFCFFGTIFFSYLLLGYGKTFGKYVCLSLIVIIMGITITQKEVISYAWHGGDCVGLYQSDTQYTPSHIPGLEGCIFDYDTEIGYQNIIDIINTYSTENDMVYEFPHITLFNVLTERDLGTFAVSHYIDVCPDKILEQDIHKVKVQKPEIFIWDQLSEQSWAINEHLFRNNKLSESREMISYYEKGVKREYQLAYRYARNNIYVYVKSPNNQKNLQLALCELKNYAKLYRPDMYQSVNRHSINEYSEILSSDEVWTIKNCIAYILFHDVELNQMMKEEDYYDLFPEMRKMFDDDDKLSDGRMRKLKGNFIMD